MGVSLSGVSSGIDSATIVSQLMALERQKLNLPRLRDAGLRAQETGLKDIQSKLTALKSAAIALRSPSLWSETQTVDSSDPSKLTATRTGGAVPGAFTVNVTRLAAGEQRTYDFTQQSAASQITIGSTTIDLAAGATLDDAVQAVNAKAGSPVFATAVGGQLVLSSRGTGTAASFTATGAGISEDTTKQRLAVDAQYSIDNGPVQTSGSNTVANALPGISMTFKALGSTTVSVGVSAVDPQAVTDKVKAFVDAYNTLVTATRNKMTEKGVANATTETDAAKGRLFADRGLSSMLSRLRTAITDVVAGNPATMDELRELGISTGAASSTINADSVAGKLTLDESKLKETLTSDPNAVKQLLGGLTGTDGFAQRIEAFVKSEAEHGGILDARLESTAAQRKEVADQIAATERRLDTTEKRLKAQFTAMETALTFANSQGSWLSAQLSALS